MVVFYPLVLRELWSSKKRKRAYIEREPLEEMSKRDNREYAHLAQSAEHAAVNRRVVGSSPTVGAKRKRDANASFFFWHFMQNMNL